MASTTRLLILICLAVMPASAFAQASTSESGEIIRRVKPGRTAIVWWDGGDVVTGRVIGVTDTSITIARQRQQLEIPVSAVQRIERPKDRVWNGGLVGLGIGFGFGAFTMLTCHPEEILCDHGPQAVLGLGAFTGAVGFGVGVLTDALIRHKRVLFERPASAPKIEIAPIVATGARGVALRVAF